MKIGLREANLHFSKYIQLVRDGEEIILTERGEPIAVIKPLRSGSDTLQSRLKALETRGVIKRATRGALRLPRAVRVRGKTLSKLVSSGRDRQF